MQDIAVDTPPTEVKAPALPPPLVKVYRHPIQWLYNKVHLLIALVILANVGMFIAVAAYYLIFETNPTMTAFWHWLVQNGSYRHVIRNVGEGLLGGLLAQQVIWNHYRKRRAKTRLDELEISLHIANVKDDKRLSVWQLISSSLLAPIYAIPGFLVAAGIVYLIHHNAGHIDNTVAALQPHVHLSARDQSIWTKFEKLWLQNWNQKLIGYGAALFFGRRPVKGVFDDLQLWFVERRISKNQPVHWYHPPTIQARYHDVRDNGAPAPEHHGFWETALIRGGLALGICLAGYGWYIMTFVATS